MFFFNKVFLYVCETRDKSNRILFTGSMEKNLESKVIRSTQSRLEAIYTTCVETLKSVLNVVNCYKTHFRERGAN
jgi:hypothetical protein